MKFTDLDTMVSPARRYGLSLSVMAIVIFCTYFKILSGKFISDDWPMIANNPHLQSISSIPGYFTSGIWKMSQFNIQEETLYRPLYLLYYHIIYTGTGPSPFWFHVSLLIIHIVNSFMVFRILQKINPDSNVTLLVLCTLLFALHPALTQAVGWISGGTDVVMTAFFLAGFLAYLKKQEEVEPVWFLLSAIFFAAALLVKETAVAFPFLVVTYEFYTGKRVVQLINRYNVLFFGILFVYLLVRTSIVDLPALTFSYENFLRLLEQVVMTFRFILVPWPQPFYFEYPAKGIATAMDILPGLVFLFLSVVLYIRCKSSRFGLIWMMLAVLPTLSVALHSEGVFALRLLYLPVIGLVIAVFPCFEIFRKKQSIYPETVLVFVIFILAVVTAAATKDWVDERSFYSKVIQSDPQSESGYIGMANFYSRNGDNEKSINFFNRGIVNVSEKKGQRELLMLLAPKYAESGRFRECLSTYERVNQLHPDASSYVGTGNCYWLLKEFDKAAEMYIKAIQADPKNSLALVNYAQISVSMGNQDIALKYYRQVLRLPPQEVDPAALKQAQAFMKKMAGSTRQQ